MQILRTPDDRFAGLQDYPFAPNYVTLGDGLRVHFVDEGPRDGPTIILMHGEPSWSYLYRKMIPPLVAAGCRVLAPDLVGFGKSDKPTAQDDYTYERHVGWMLEWLGIVDPQDVTLFCQDWGGLLGLRLVTAEPDRFAAVVASNTGLPIGEGFGEAFLAWLQFSQNVPEFPAGMILQSASTRELSAAEVAAYDAPFPDESYKAGARRFPALVPITPDHPSVAENRAAWDVLRKFDKPFVTAFGDADRVTAGNEKLFQDIVPGAKGQDHVMVAGGHHFIQEDAPDQLVHVIIATMMKIGALAD